MIRWVVYIKGCRFNIIFYHLVTILLIKKIVHVLFIILSYTMEVFFILASCIQYSNFSVMLTNTLYRQCMKRAFNPTVLDYNSFLA